jgi:hypothetical protein
MGARFMASSPAAAVQQVSAQWGMGGFVSAASKFPVTISMTVANGSMAALTTATTTSSTPLWVNSLATQSIRTDMGKSISNGKVTYNGLLTLLNNLDATLTSSKTKLTSTQLKDLQTIVANLNNGVSTSSYLTDVMQSLVKGDAANATWTGGQKTSVALGNLAVGSNATQLSQLIGKWFLGTDLPSSQVSMSGVSSFNVSYSTSAKPVFASSGPSMSDINQGYLGDCYLLASLAEVAQQNPDVLRSMITSNGNGTYGVRFYLGGKADYVTVNSSLANGGGIFNYGADIWGSLVEKAYAQLQAGGVVTGNSINYGNSWSTIGNGGYVERALAEVTGATSITDFRANGGSWAAISYNQNLSMTGYALGQSSNTVWNTLVTAINNHYDVVLSSWTNAWDSTGKQTLVKGHAMSISGYDTAAQTVQVRNPWGTENGQRWATTFNVSLSTLLAAGDTITVDNGPGPGALASLSGVSSIAANLTQAISSMPSSVGALTSSLTQLASATPPTLASPTHC